MDSKKSVSYRLSLSGNHASNMQSLPSETLGRAAGTQCQSKSEPQTNPEIIDTALTEEGSKYRLADTSHCGKACHAQQAYVLRSNIFITSEMAVNS